MAADVAHESVFQWLARFEFVTRGLLYIMIAWLVVATGRTEDLTGAMEYLGGGAGRWIMIFIVAGMAGYGLWRVSDAAFGMDSGRDHPKAWRRRVAAACSGGIYLYLAYKALMVMLGVRHIGGGARENAELALHLPAGTLALAIAAAVLVGAGFVQLWKAGSCSFLYHLDEAARRPLAKWLGRTGYAARAIIFVTIGWMLARAALDNSAAEAGGLEEALDALRGPLEIPVAAGLALFGVYSLVEARYRSIHKPPTHVVKRKVRETLAG